MTKTKRPEVMATRHMVVAVKPGEMVLSLGSPGSEVLGQAQLQVLLNIRVFSMTPQAAIEASRFASFSWPASALPHVYHPAPMKVERGVGEDVGEALSARGHEVQWWPDQEWRAGSVCTIRADQSNGILHGGADPRRMAYAVGW